MSELVTLCWLGKIVVIGIIDPRRQREQERMESGSVRDVVSFRVTLQSQLTAEFEKLVRGFLPLRPSY